LFATGPMTTLVRTVLSRASERRARDRGLLDSTTGSKGFAAWTGATRPKEGSMRIYEGSPRQDFEEVFRSIGAFLDRRNMRDILLLEVPDGYVVQGLVATQSTASAWSESVGSTVKETLTYLDEDIAKFMEEAVKRRGSGEPIGTAQAAPHERALRVIGRWMDEQKPRDVFLFEQDGAYVVRLLVSGQGHAHHILAEFTADDVEGLVAQGPSLRAKTGSTTPVSGG
jgi:hypothetical protein